MSFLLAGSAQAWHVTGCVKCDTNGNGVLDTGDEAVAGAIVTIAGLDVVFSATAVTGANGCYAIDLPDDPFSYKATLDPASIPAHATFVSPATNMFTFSLTDAEPALDAGHFLLGPATCEPPPEPEDLCWLTGGGVKFEAVTRSYLAERGPTDSLGGNVNPSCDPDPGEGGQWNHVAHSEKLHFQGFAIQVVRCGNVPGIEPGSESPVTPFNFIEFQGTGRLKGIKSNRVEYTDVHFFARCEDHNEPGSNGAKDGVDIDRYFLHVFLSPADPAGSTLLLIDVDGDPTTVDPVLITGGNLQMHKCDEAATGGGGSLQDAYQPYFVRGDANWDGAVDLSDAVAALRHLFLGREAPPCLDAADANDDGELQVTDPIFVLASLYAGSSPPPAPFPGADIDPTDDLLGCQPE